MRSATWDAVYSLLHQYVVQLGASNLFESDVADFVRDIVEERGFEKAFSDQLITADDFATWLMAHTQSRFVGVEASQRSSAEFKLDSDIATRIAMLISR